MESGKDKLEEKEFYNEVDKEAKGSCCTCPSIAGLFLVILIGSVIGNYYIFNKIKFTGWRLSADKKTDGVTLDVPAARKNVSYAQSVTIKESDLQKSVIDSKLLVIPLSDKQILIKTDGIYCEGKIPVVGTKISVKMVPAVENGEIVIKEISVRSGPQSFGQEFSSLIKDKVARAMNDSIAGKMKVEGLELKDGEMVVGGS